MTIEALPPAPAATDPVDIFDAKAFAFNAALAAFRTQANEMAAEMQINADVAAAIILAMALPQFAGTSSSSVTIGTGAKTFVTQTGKGWLPGQIVVVTSGSNYVKGSVTSYSGANLSVNVTSVNGSGTLGVWDIGLSYDGLSLAKAGDNSDITRLLGLTTPVSEVRRIQPISASVSGNALTISVGALALEFRSSTLGSGATSFVKGTPANLVISSGSTLGAINATQSRIVVLALNNAGTIELAAVNLAGGNDLSETGLISTTAEGGAGAADSASVIYSTTARTGVAYCVIGYIESTQATAGTWATAPSTIQGQGGQALAAMSSGGFGQTPQTVTRNIGTTYYGAAKPIGFSYYQNVNNTAGTGAALTVNGVQVASCIGGAAGIGMAQNVSMYYEIPPFAIYSLSGNAGNVTERR